jgi:hypothetical protein
MGAELNRASGDIGSKEANRRFFERLGGEWRLVGAYPGETRPSSRVLQLDVLSRLSYAGPYVLELWERTR